MLRCLSSISMFADHSVNFPGVLSCLYLTRRVKSQPVSGCKTVYLAPTHHSFESLPSGPTVEIKSELISFTFRHLAPLEKCIRRLAAEY